MLALTLIYEGNSMPFSIARILVLVVFICLYSTSGNATEPPPVQSDNLLRESIAGVEGKEIIVSRVSIPPHTELPWHGHPGEEFFYVIEGSVTLKRRGEPDLPGGAGDAQNIAVRVIHTGSTGEQGAELVIFRVHAAGEPERYLVD